MGSPGAICLISGVNDPGAVFALSGKVGRSPRVFAARDRDGILRQMQAAALKRMGITLAGGFEPSQGPMHCWKKPGRHAHGTKSSQSSLKVSACCQECQMCIPAVCEKDGKSHLGGVHRSPLIRPDIAVSVTGIHLA